MFIVHGSFRIPLDALEDLRATLAPLLIATRAEPGCVSYDWAQSLDDPEQFYSIEVWQSREDLEAHMASDHAREGFADMPSILIGEPILVGFASDDQVNLLS